MIFIVMEHATYFKPSVYLPTSGLRLFFFSLSILFSKFGTISFFLMAGFLIGDKFTDYTPLQYLKRRLDSTIFPWLFWSLLLIVFINFNLIKGKVLLRADPAGVNVWHTLLESVKGTYFYTNYWFIPNFLFCITLLLIFKRHLYSYKFGAVLLLFTLFYSVNIYFSWIPPTHTLAILGFVFFLWLGAQFHQNWQNINTWLSNTSLLMWVALTVLCLGLSMAETYLLRNLHVKDPYNTLRLSNILYSLSFFFMLLRIRSFKLINYLKPRETTYGIYLIHFVVLEILLSQIVTPLNINVYNLSVPIIILFQLTKFAAVYGSTLLVIWIINLLRLKRLVGR